MAKKSKVTPHYLLGIWPQTPKQRTLAGQPDHLSGTATSPEVGRPKLLPIEGGPCFPKGCACIFASYHTPARQKKEAIEDEVLVPRHGVLVIKVPRTGDREGGKPKGEPGHACSWLPVHLSARVALCIKPQPPVLLEGVSGVWRCRWIEGGLKGSLSSG